MSIKKLKLSAFIPYLVLFFSRVLILFFLIFGLTIIFINIGKNNFFVSKNTANLLSFILNGIFSTTNNISILITFPKENMNIYFFENNITVKRGDDVFSSKIYKPRYLTLEFSNEKNFIEITDMFNVKLLIIKENERIIISETI